MVANPVQQIESAGRVGRAAAAVSGALDLTASAGVILGEPTIDVDDPNEPGEPGPTPTPSVKGTKLPNTGLGLPVGTLAALGLVLVGAGALLGTIARRRREEAAHS
jgi:LPXTG-motif cell wall-anchored protein